MISLLTLACKIVINSVLYFSGCHVLGHLNPLGTNFLKKILHVEQI